MAKFRERFSIQDRSHGPIDRRGHRIGYGAGYYDRSLALLRARKTIHAVGVAYGICEVPVVPDEAHDQILDAIVTERETILVSVG